MCLDPKGFERFQSLFKFQSLQLPSPLCVWPVCANVVSCFSRKVKDEVTLFFRVLKIFCESLFVHLNADTFFCVWAQNIVGMRTKIWDFILCVTSTMEAMTSQQYFNWYIMAPIMLVSCQLLIQGTVENANSEKASRKVAWCTVHFSLWSVKCWKDHATFHEANPGLYFLVCKVINFCMSSKKAKAMHCHQRQIFDCNIFTLV